MYIGKLESKARDQIIMVRAKKILSFIKKESTKFTIYGILCDF